MSDLEHRATPDTSKANDEISFEGVETREVLVNGTPTVLSKEGYEVYKKAGAEIKGIGHSGSHGETPVTEFDNTPLPQAVQDGLVSSEGIPVTSTPPAHDTIPGAASPRRRRRLNKTTAWMIGGAMGIAVTAGVATPVIAKFADKGGGEGLNPDQTASASPFPNYSPSIDQVYMTDGDPAYPEVKEHTPLTSEQLSSWQSGDLATQNAVAYDVVAPRLQAAVFEAYDAEHQGVDVDLSWFSTDPLVQAEVRRVASEFTGVTPKDPGDWYALEVCRDFDYDTLARCNVKNLVDNKVPNLVDGAVAIIYSDPKDPDGDEREHGRGFQLNAHIELVGDSLEFVSNSAQ